MAVGSSNTGILVFQLYALLQAQKDEITDLQEEHHRQREELEETQTELIKTLKLKYWGTTRIPLLVRNGCSCMRCIDLCRQLILDSFVPPDEKSKVFDRAYYDEDEEDWKLKLLARPDRQVHPLS